MYYTFTIPKKSGGVRTISAPDKNLKAFQRGLLRMLQKQLWLSRRAHGFAKNRNILTNAKVHVGKRWILNLDIRDFFPSIRQEGVTMTNRSKGEKFFSHTENTYRMYHNEVLPQGAPTSPFLSNYFMRDFDTQIVGLLRKLVSDDIEYTRYADDMTFSSNSRAIERVVGFVESRLRSMKMKLNDDKTRLMGRGQRQEITGLNINSGRPTIPKKYRRKVRALVHRASNGWIITHKQMESLLGMISHVALCHPEEAKKYREALSAVNPATATRRLGSIKRIHLQAKKKHSASKGISAANTHNQSTRKLRRINECVN